VNVGFTSDAAAEKPAVRVDTSVPGNGNRGHRYGTDLSDADKADLLEFLKTM
jgi:hypothetical protein